MILTNYCRKSTKLSRIKKGNRSKKGSGKEENMQRIAWFVFMMAGSLVIAGRDVYATQALVAVKVDTLPVIDGKADEAAWDKAGVVITRDKIANIDITLKAVYTAEGISFLVQFPDADESRSHKSWVWDKNAGIYVTGHDREDVFQFVFSMENKPVNLSIYADTPYVADVWFWKACRTDPQGYADDKIHYLLEEKPPEGNKAIQSVGKSGRIMYFIRDNDKGTQAFKSNVYGEYLGDKLSRFSYQQPTGSAADIKAKGRWQEGIWTIEFSRALHTGYPDDVQFDPNKEYIFGVSRYEIAGRDPEPSLTQPLYGTGDVGEELLLSFMKN
jgi:hypothetical protein